LAWWVGASWWQARHNGRLLYGHFKGFLRTVANNAPAMIFICVLQEPPKLGTRRGASFYEMHEIHIPRVEVNAPRDKVCQVELTFETTGLDPFPPGAKSKSIYYILFLILVSAQGDIHGFIRLIRFLGCSHVFGQSDEVIEACYRRINGRVHLPELYTNNSGIFILGTPNLHLISHLCILFKSSPIQTATGEELLQLPYLQESLLSETRLLCAKHQCEVKIVRSALRGDTHSTVLAENGSILATDRNYESNEEVEPWRVSMEDTVEHPFLHMLQWMPTLRFEFTHPSMSCRRLENLFNVVSSRDGEKNLPYPRMWRRNTDLFYLSSLLSTSFWRFVDKFSFAWHRVHISKWARILRSKHHTINIIIRSVLLSHCVTFLSHCRKQDRPHQVYYAPVFCVKSTPEASRVQGRLPLGTFIYPFQGLTVMWSVHWRKTVMQMEAAPQLRIRSIQVIINSAKSSSVCMLFDCGDTNCTLSINVELNTVLTHSVYILPKQVFLNETSSSFALILDGPEFSLNTGTSDRRVQLFRDGHLLILGTYPLPQLQPSATNFFQATEFLVLAGAFAQPRSRMFELIVRGMVSTFNDHYDFHRFGDWKFFYAADFRLCQTVCAEANKVAPHVGSNPSQFVCIIENEPVPCDPRLSIPKTLNANIQLTNGPGKEVILSSRCPYSTFILLYAQIWNIYDSESKSLLQDDWANSLPIQSCYKRDTADTILTSDDVVNQHVSSKRPTFKNDHFVFPEKWFNRVNLQNYGDLLCQEDSLLFLMSPTCRVKIDEQNTGVDLVQLHVYPVFQGCREFKLESPDVKVAPFAAAASHSRACSPGYFMSKIPPHKCEPCPKDTFSDPDTASDECLPCPDVRNTTGLLPARSSIHCTNHLLDQERERLAYKAIDLVPEAVPRSTKIGKILDHEGEYAPISEKEVLRHLAPDPLLLIQQETAEGLFKEITQLTFSIEELFTMILIALALALMVAITTFIIGTASRRTAYASRRQTIIRRLLNWMYRHLRVLHHNVGPLA
uniref:Ephrin_rec_like domain-containing protein n=1 Tax=Hydatigena taeniaeformis TaxID=6205 RepID=A0A158REP1_HYDTA